MIKSKLAELKEKHKLSQNEIHLRTGIRPQTLSNISNNNIKQIPVDVLDSLCKLFNCGIGDIFEYVDDDK